VVAHIYNQIYGYVLQPPHYIPHDSPDSEQGGQSCWNLINLCRQIRAETSPLLQDLEVRLSLQDAANYAKTIVDVEDSVFLSQLKSKLVIDMPNEFNGHIDVLPIIQLRLVAPHVKI
jgi:hypothetical protein